VASTRKRARELLPNVLLTLLSIVQALALETFWNRFQSSDYLWQGGWPAFLGWLQVLVIVMGIAEIWLFYVSLILRFTWVPGVRDMLLPFFIGLLQFTLVHLQGIERIGAWLLCLSVIFAVVVTESHLIFNQARRDPANQLFFIGVEPATLRDFKQSIALVGALALAGLLLMWTGNQSWLALVSLLYALGAISWQMNVTGYYWKITITDAPE
jgi:hypothetical protein